MWFVRAVNLEPRPEGHVTGTSFCAHRDEIEAVYGKDVLQRAVGHLEHAQRHHVMDALPVSLVPISTQQALYEALAAETGARAEQLHVEIVRRSTERVVRTIWRVLLRFTSDEALVSRAPILFRKSFCQGKLVAEKIAPGRARLRVSEWPGMPAFSLRGLRVGIETILTLAGRQDARVRCEATADGATLEANWNP